MAMYNYVWLYHSAVQFMVLGADSLKYLHSASLAVTEPLLPLFKPLMTGYPQQLHTLSIKACHTISCGVQPYTVSL